MDPFATLGLSLRFDLDVNELEKRYRDLQRALHPDKHMDAGALERRAALSKAVEVNEAYRVLRDELSRAAALLAAHGVNVSSESKADPELLMEVMELREALADARSSSDQALIDKLASDVRSLESTTRVSMKDAFVASDWKRASTMWTRMRYLRRFLDEVNAILEEKESAAARGA